MALSAVTTLNPNTTVSIGKPVTLLITVSNSGASPIQITEIVPKFSIAGDSIYHDPQDVTPSVVNLNANPWVAAGGSTDYTTEICFQSPSNQFSAYIVSALVYGSDGQLIQSSAVTITVTRP